MNEELFNDANWLIGNVGYLDCRRSVQRQHEGPLRVGSGRKYQLCKAVRGKLEIGVQAARRLRSDLSGDALLELAKIVNGLSRDGVTRSAFGQLQTFKSSFICFLLYIISLKQLHSSFYSPKSCRI